MRLWLCVVYFVSVSCFAAGGGLLETISSLIENEGEGKAEQQLSELLALETQVKRANQALISANYHLSLSKLYSRISSLNEALAHAELGFEALRDYPRPPGELLAELHLQMGLAYGNLDRYQKAREHFGKGIALAEQMSSKTIMLDGYLSRVWLDNMLGEVGLAIKDINKANQLAEEIGTPVDKSIVNNHLGQIYEFLRDSEQALHYYQRGLDIVKAVGDRREDELTFGYNLAIAHYRLKQYEQAEQGFKYLLTMANEKGNKSEAYILWIGLLKLYNATQTPDKALHALSELEALQEHNDSPFYESEYLLGKAQTDYLRQDYETGLVHIRQAREYGEKYLPGDLYFLIDLFEWEAKHLAGLKRFEQSYLALESKRKMERELHGSSLHSQRPKWHAQFDNLHLKRRLDEADKGSRELAQRWIEQRQSYSQYRYQALALGFGIFLVFVWLMRIKSRHTSGYYLLDGLTQVLGRSALINAIKRDMKGKDKYTLLMVKVGNMAEINIRTGTSAGDVKLQQVSQQLKVWSGDHPVGRFSSSCFVVGREGRELEPPELNELRQYLLLESDDLLELLIAQVPYTPDGTLESMLLQGEAKLMEMEDAMWAESEHA